MEYVCTRLVTNETLASGYFVLRLGPRAHLTKATPGQFVMLRGDWGSDPLLPRAFSLLGVDAVGTAEILIKTVGKGSRRLELTPPGAPLFVLGPLGVGFSAPEAGRKDLLVAGGVGLAPLLMHAEQHAAAATEMELFYGARCARDLVLGERITRSGVAVHYATEDGSRGTRGYVTAALEARLDAMGAGAGVRILACGPTPMLEAVRRLAQARKIPCFLSLEGEMACGIGACLGCAVATKSKPYRYVCKDGPVLDAEDLA